MNEIKRNGNILIATSRRPDLIENVQLFSNLMYFSLPDLEMRISLIHFLFSEVPLDKEIDLESISKYTEGFSFKDLKRLKNLVIERGIQRSQEEGVDFLLIKEDFARSYFRKEHSKMELRRYEQFERSMIQNFTNFFEELQTPNNINNLVQNDPKLNLNDEDLYGN